MSFKRFDYGLLAALWLPLFALMPLILHSGLPNTADGPVHLMRQVEFNQAWMEGNYYPRWGFDLALGHGMPIFSYAPPALYFLTQFFHLLGLPLDAAMKAVVMLDLCLYSLGMYLLVRRIFGAYPALIAAAVHIYAPYRLREVYIQGNYGQLTGLACYPFILWAFHGLITTRHPRYMVAAPLSLAALLFSHNISAMLFAPLLAAYLLFLLILELYTQRNQPKLIATSLSLTLIAGLLGLGLAAIFWLPAFGERHDIKLEGITRDFFDFRENFVTLPELLSPPKPLDRAAINPEFPLSLGLAQIIGAIAAMLVLLMWYFKPPSPLPSPQSYPLAHSLFFTGALLFYGFLAIPPSQFLWEAIPLLELTEFPWRMLGPAVCCASVVAAITPYYLSTKPVRLLESRQLEALFFTVIFLAIIINFYYLYPAQFIAWGSPTPRQVFQYEMTTGAIGTTSTGEFLPRTAQQHPEAHTLWPDYEANRPPQRFDSIPPNVQVDRLHRQAEAETWQINTPQPFTATLRLLHWPGWNFYLDNAPTPYTVITPTGLVQIAIPSGQHTLTMQLEATPLRSWGKWLSIFALLTLGITVIVLYQITTINAESVSHLSPLNYQLLLKTVFLFSLIYILTRPLESYFTLQSDPNLPLLADQHAEADFGNQIRLVGFDELSTPTLAPGDKLKVILYWRALQKLDINYSVFVHLDAPNGQTYATVDEPDPEFIPSRNWSPSLYLRNVLQMTIPPDLPPIRYEVNVGVYNRQDEARLTLPNSANHYTIGYIWLTQPEPTLPPQPLAQYGEHIKLWHVELHDQYIMLYWQTAQTITQNDTLFIHLLDSSGNLIGQMDGLPYQGNYPLPYWRPGQVIIDTRSLEPTVRPNQILVGLYDPITGQRLPATDAQAHPLPDDSYRYTVAP